MIVLDTNVISEAMKPQPNAAVRAWLNQQVAETSTSPSSPSLNAVGDCRAAGRTAQEAFFVNCGELENPADQRARGLLVAEVGVAPATPFEFVVIRIGVSDNALELSETGRVEATS